MKYFIGGVIVFLGFFNGALGACTIGISTFTALSGFFTSPNYPNKYPNSQRCIYEFDTGYPVTISCHEFELQDKNNEGKCKDSLGIKDDTTTYCGTDAPNNLQTTGTTSKLLFKSNDKRKSTGFNCTYVSITTSNLLQSALDLYSSETCYTTVRSTCGCTGITSDDSEYDTTTSGDYRIVVANGIASHDYEVGQEVPNPNTACPHELFMAILKNPTKGDTYTEYALGPAGIAISGGFFYNHLSSPFGDLAVPNEGESFDSCGGHSDPNCRYHYHELPTCIAAGEDDCSFIGYMRDGFSVYTYCTHETESRYLTSCYELNDGEVGSMSSHYTYSETAYDNGECDLDRANGYTFSDERGYSYIFTEDYPFIMAGYYGTELSDLCYIEDAAA